MDRQTADANVILDYAMFQMSAAQNRFSAVICCKGRTEEVYSGVLEHLFLCVPEAREASYSDKCFKLQPHERSNDTDAPWFTKSTLNMFLNFVSSTPEALKKINSVQTELNQLEETRKFHLTLYTKDKLAKVEGFLTDNEGLKQVESTQKVKVETVSSEVTKNELLRALELRLTSLDKELAGIVMQTLGTNHSKDEISNLLAFVEQFGSDFLGHALRRFSTYHYEGSPANDSKDQSVPSHESSGSVGDLPGESSPRVIENSQKFLRNGISPAKIAEAERRSPTESEDSSDSSDGEGQTVERSRPVIRSASPRRSASPMRRVQIGRSGYRRPAALTIKSLSFIPAREKPLFSRDADSDADEESSELKAKPSENSVVRMSVQDRINLFESKQRDQTMDNQKKTKGTEAPFGVKKSVLRRWSSGMGDSSTHLEPEITPDERSESPAESIVDANQNSTDGNSDLPLTSSNPVKYANSFPLEKVPSSRMDSSISSVASQAEEMPDRAAVSAEWTRQKEAELNEMLMKMMGNKTSIISTDGSGGVSESSLERKGDFYSQYKEKRDEKLRAENGKKKAEKEAKFKVMQETLEQRRSEMAKKVTASGKPNPSIQSQKPRRNSSPPVLSKKESPAPTAPRKASPKTPSSLPATRKSLSSVPSTRAAATPPKSSTSTSSVRSTVINRRKPQPTTPPTNAGPRAEKPRQLKATKATPPETKTSLKNPEAKKPKEVTKSSKVIHKEPAATVDNVSTPTKPSFYNKVTRKNSVVPLESKASVKKAFGTNSGVGPVTLKTQIPQCKESSKNSATPIQIEPKRLLVEAIEQSPSENHATLSIAAESNVDESSKSVHSEKVETDDTETVEVMDNKNPIVNFPVAEIDTVEDLSISSTAWVEAEHQAMTDLSNTNVSQTVNPMDDVPDSFSNSRVRHSLSQMLQADNGESEIIEWGNAENPPSLVYQKDAPKGFKRLLKFARKNKADSNSTGWSSPSAFSDGDEEAQESKYLNKKNTDVLSKKTAVKTKASGKQRNMLAESYDGGNQRLSDLSAKHDILSTNSFPAAYKSRDGHVSTSNASGKATRSFFSFSNFRSK